MTLPPTERGATTLRGVPTMRIIVGIRGRTGVGTMGASAAATSGMKTALPARTCWLMASCFTEKA